MVDVRGRNKKKLRLKDSINKYNIILFIKEANNVISYYFSISYVPCLMVDVLNHMRYIEEIDTDL